jgi:hypothetical protein
MYLQILLKQSASLHHISTLDTKHPSQSEKGKELSFVQLKKRFPYTEPGRQGHKT